MKLVSAVCLEQFVIVLHHDPAVVTQVILALHFMIKPLHWVLGSISLLPNELMDLLHSPQPMLVGTTMRINHSEETHIHVDLVKNRIVGAQGSEISKSPSDDDRNDNDIREKEIIYGRRPQSPLVDNKPCN
jgi:hypothetical protein